MINNGISIRINKMGDWYSYREFNFSKPQILWALEYLVELRDGRWPPEGVSNYNEILSPRRANSEARFIKPANIASEIDSRLNRTGIEGKLLLSEIWQGLSLIELAPESISALNYISGWRRKKMPYRAWKKAQKYYHLVIAKMLVCI